jgi:hypothetical protein
MAYEMDVLDISLLAGADLSALQYCFVKLTADNTVEKCGAGEQAIGILQNKPDTIGQAARVRVFGVSRFVNGTAGAIAFGVKVKSDADGKGVAAAANKDLYFGIVLDGVAAVDNLATILITGVNSLSA